MQIFFQDVLPTPLAESFKNNQNSVKSEIWQNNITFEKGTKYKIYAPSGKGKSTFIHLIYGLRRDYAGQIHIDNQAIDKYKRKDWAMLRQKRLSIVFQDLRLFLHLTAWENIQVKAVLQNQISNQEIQVMADYLGIAHVLQKKAGLLSYGERQRTAIIRALMQPFDFILLDEPFSHLDEENIRKASELIEQKREKYQAGMLMTTLGDDYAWEFDNKVTL